MTDSCFYDKKIKLIFLSLKMFTLLADYQSNVWSDGEIAANNAALGALPVWCDKNLEEDLRKVVEQRYGIRDAALRALLAFDPVGSYKLTLQGSINVAFTDNFYSYFYVNHPCLCQGLVGEGKPTESVKKSDVFVDPKYEYKDKSEEEEEEEKAERMVFHIIKKHKAGKAGQTFIIGDGTQKLIMKRMENVTFQKYLDVMAVEYDMRMVEVNPSLEYNRFLTHDGRRVIIKVPGDNFSNQTCLHMIIDIILRSEREENNNYIYQYDTFFCRKGSVVNGYNIMENAQLGELSEYLETAHINNEDLEEMLRQILTPLKILKNKKYGFLHADLKCKNVFVGGTRAKPIFKVADYDKSSIFWRGARFYNSSGIGHTKDVITDSGAPLLTFPPIVVGEDQEYGIFYYFIMPVAHIAEKLDDLLIGKMLSLVTGNTPLKKLSDALYYRVQKSYAQSHLFFSPYGFFASYDIYTLFISLLMEPSIFEHMQGPRMRAGVPIFPAYSAWRELWFPNEFNVVMGEIEKLHIRLGKEGLKSKEAYDKFLDEEMRSITAINKFLFAHKFRLKADIDIVYSILGVRIEQAQANVENRIPPKIIVTGTDNFLVKREYKQGNDTIGKTNKYSAKMGVYDWNYIPKGY